MLTEQDEPIFQTFRIAERLKEAIGGRFSDQKQRSEPLHQLANQKKRFAAASHKTSTTIGKKNYAKYTFLRPLSRDISSAQPLTLLTTP